MIGKGRVYGWALAPCTMHPAACTPPTQHLTALGLLRFCIAVPAQSSELMEPTNAALFHRTTWSTSSSSFVLLPAFLCICPRFLLSWFPAYEAEMSNEFPLQVTLLPFSQSKSNMYLGHQHQQQALTQTHRRGPASQSETQNDCFRFSFYASQVVAVVSLARSDGRDGGWPVMQ